MVAGCSEVVGTGSAPPIDCTPTVSPWPMYGYNPARTSHTPERNLPLADAEASRLSQTGTQPHSGGSVDAPPVVDDGVVYVGGDVRIEARNLQTGERVWATDPDDSIKTSPVLACGTLYVSTLNETLALDREDGSVLWRADVGTHGNVAASPAVVDDTVYVGGGAVALDAETGTERWHVQTEHVANGVAVADRVYIGAGSNDSGEVAAVTRHGETWWRTTAPGPVYATPAIADGTVYALSKTGTVTALAAADGTVQWQAHAEDQGIHGPPAVADDRVIVAAGNGTHTMAFDAATGDRLWQFKTGVSAGVPTVVGDRVLASGANTGIYLLDAATGRQLRHWPVDYVGSQVAIADSHLFYRAWNVSDLFVVG